jgi:drug/metabolite transporter superfamily protein YnfA
MWLTGQDTYAAGRLPFILVSACVPLVTATLAFRLSRQAWLATASGLLSIFSLYYAPFMPVPDNYGLYMLFGGIFLLVAPRRERWVAVLLGALAGLMTLARSDGLLWLGLAGLTEIWKAACDDQGLPRPVAKWLPMIIPAGLFVVVGYLLTMGFWHVRNLSLFGSPLAPGGGRLLWLQNYNQTFIYPPEALTRESLLQAGWEPALESRLRAFSANLGNAFAAQGGIFLLPFILIALWQLRADLRTRIAVTGWLILFVVMTVIFPFAGARGSFFHAGAAFQPYWWAAAPIGLHAVLGWARKHNQFTDRNAPYFLQSILVLLAVFMTAYLVNFRVVASGWAEDDFIYPAVERLFVENGIGPDDVVVVRNPPGYYIASGRSAISLPFGDEGTILAVAEKFNGRYLVLEKDGTFESIQDLYDDPEIHSSFHYLGEVNEAKLYRIELAD